MDGAFPSLAVGPESECREALHRLLPRAGDKVGLGGPWPSAAIVGREGSSFPDIMEAGFWSSYKDYCRHELAVGFVGSNVGRAWSLTASTWVKARSKTLPNFLRKKSKKRLAGLPHR